MIDRNTWIGLTAAFLTLFFVFLNQEKNREIGLPRNKQAFFAQYGTPTIDGIAEEAVWANVEWLLLDQIWIGGQLASEDFFGRYKLLWDENNLYVLAEITDDTLVDTHADGLSRYWDDDCLEIFVDEDASGGNHQFSIATMHSPTISRWTAKWWTSALTVPLLTSTTTASCGGIQSVIQLFGK